MEIARCSIDGNSRSYFRMEWVQRRRHCRGWQVRMGLVAPWRRQEQEVDGAAEAAARNQKMVAARNTPNTTTSNTTTATTTTTTALPEGPTFGVAKRGVAAGAEGGPAAAAAAAGAETDAAGAEAEEAEDRAASEATTMPTPTPNVRSSRGGVRARAGSWGHQRTHPPTSGQQLEDKEEQQQ